MLGSARAWRMCRRHTSVLSSTTSAVQELVFLTSLFFCSTRWRCTMLLAAAQLRCHHKSDTLPPPRRRRLMGACIRLRAWMALRQRAGNRFIPIHLSCGYRASPPKYDAVFLWRVWPAPAGMGHSVWLACRPSTNPLI